MQGFHQVYGHTRRVYTVLANPMHSAQCMLHNAAQRALQSVRCIMYNAQCMLHNAQCTLQVAGRRGSTWNVCVRTDGTFVRSAASSICALSRQPSIFTTRTDNDWGWSRCVCVPCQSWLSLCDLCDCLDAHFLSAIAHIHTHNAYAHIPS